MGQARGPGTVILETEADSVVPGCRRGLLRRPLGFGCSCVTSRSVDSAEEEGEVVELPRALSAHLASICHDTLALALVLENIGRSVG